MEALRAFGTANRGSIINVVYVVVFLIVGYYLYRFLFSTDLERNLLNVQMPANETGEYSLGNDPDIRVKYGGAYSLSFWMYISGWEARAGRAKSVLQITDSGLTNDFLFNTVIYPNEAKMMIRFLTDGSSEVDPMTNIAKHNCTLANACSGTTPYTIPTSGEMPMCDLLDIDLQRWINITAVVNGRIADIYYDGKLARSCVLPNIIKASPSGIQKVLTGQNSGFGGYVSGINFFAYPLTPDRVYSIYQDGPRSSGGFLSYLAEKLGIKITYSGAGGQQRTTGST